MWPWLGSPGAPAMPFSGWKLQKSNYPDREGAAAAPCLSLTLLIAVGTTRGTSWGYS